MFNIMIDRNFTTTTLQRLVQINSINPALEGGGAGEMEIGKYIHDLLGQMNIEAEIDVLSPGRINVTGKVRGSGGGKSLMLNAHMDTVGVAGMSEPFSGKIENGKLYGRGSYDMKGGIAAMLGAAKAIQEKKMKLKGDLVFSFVADEEYESLGAQALVKKIKTDAAIVTEPTDLKICLAHRGFGIYKITTHGKTAHGGNHHIGIDANLKMGLLLATIDKVASVLPQQKHHALCGQASMHVPLIQGGRSLFIYSHACTIHLERRVLPGEWEQDVEWEIKQIINGLRQQDMHFRADLERIIWRAPYEIKKDARIVECLAASAKEIMNTPVTYIGHTWWEDSAILGEAGIDAVIMGPKGAGIHEEVEWVEVDSVIQLAEVLCQTAIRYCA